jgi:hypothetical protein
MVQVVFLGIKVLLEGVWFLTAIEYIIYRSTKNAVIDAASNQFS